MNWWKSLNARNGEPEWNVRVVTQPTFEPLTLDDVKTFLREAGTDQDALITALITSTRQYAENYTRRALCPQELEMNFQFWPCNEIIELLAPPLQSVEFVKYIDATGNQQTVDPALYQIDSVSEPGRIKPIYGQCWPPIRNYDFNAVTVRFWAGYTGSPLDGTVVPQAIRQWMRHRIATLYENREQVIIDQRGALIEVPRNYIDGLLDGFVVKLFG